MVRVPGMTKLPPRMCIIASRNHEVWSHREGRTRTLFDKHKLPSVLKLLMDAVVKFRLSFGGGGGGGAGLRFSDKITSWIMSNFKETAHFDKNK